LEQPRPDAYKDRCNANFIHFAGNQARGDFNSSREDLVGAKNGVIEIERLTPAGRNQMSAAEYSRGLPLKTGLSFG